MQKYINIHETRTDIDEPIIKVYNYGSSVYGCVTEKSDSDYIVVVESDEYLYYSVSNEEGDFTVYSRPLFIKRIKECHISVMECIFQHEDDPFVKYFELNLEALRREISAVSSNSFVKCKKKMNIGEIYIGKKSMFHSIRILMFGIQIAKYGKIVDYGQANKFLAMVMRMDSWKEIVAFFQPVYNDYKSEFKIVAPIDKDGKR
jgi:hypothetical protein